MVKITVEQFADSFDGILEEYRESVSKKIKEETQQTMKRMVRRTKSDAPKRELNNRPAGTYAKHITSKVKHQSSTGYSEIWYVKAPEYPLTHLLNNGHALRQGGRWEGSRFLTKITEDEKKNYELAIKQAIANATR